MQPLEHRTRLTTIHDFGDLRPTAAARAPYKKQIQEQLATMQIEPGTKFLSGEQIAQLLEWDTPNAGQELPGRYKRLLDKDIDVMKHDGKYSLDELALYYYRLDQAGDKDGKISWYEGKQGEGFSDRQYILEAAEGVRQCFAFPDKVIGMIKEHLHSNVYTLTKSDLQQCRNLLEPKAESDVYSREHKDRDLAESFDRSLQTLGKLPQQFVDMLTVELLGRFASTRNLPIAEWVKGKTLLLAKQFSAFKQSSLPNGISRYLICEERTPLLQTSKPDPALGPEQEFLGPFIVKDPKSYLSPQATPLLDKLFRQMRDVFLSPPGTQVLMNLYDKTYDMLDHPEQFEVALQPLHQLLTSTLNSPVNMKIVGALDTASAETGPQWRQTGGCYNDDEKSTHIEIDPIIKHWDGPRANGASEYWVRVGMLCHLVRVMSEELFHAFQFHQIEMMKQSQPLTLPQERVEDYLENHMVYTPLHLPEILWGNKDVYAEQPLEKDAHYVVERLPEVAMQAIRSLRPEIPENPSWES